MFSPYGKTTQHAIAAMSRLAEAYPDGERLSSLDIAKNRQLSKPLVAKMLTTMSQIGLVSGTPGPTGGYKLAKDPEEIFLYDIAVQFENINAEMTCPFGPGWCGKKEPCPLHHELVRLMNEVEAFLKSTSLAVFAKNPQMKP